MTLRQRLSDWTDWDGAQFALAVALGVMEDGQENWFKNKHVFWSSNPRESAFTRILQELVEADILEYRSEPDSQYRWKAES